MDSREPEPTEPASTEFGVTDNSPTAPLLKKTVSERIIRVLPQWYSPNALTLTGGSFATVSAAIVWIFTDEMRQGSAAGIFWMMTSAVLLIIYAVFDQLDGMQARKLKRSSAFGDFLDHWVDTIIANSLTVPIMVMLDLPQTMIWSMAFITALAFWAHNWETRTTNYRQLPVIGGLESVWTALFIMSITSYFGTGIWHTQWFGISLLALVYSYGIAALGWVVIRALRTSGVQLRDYLGFIAALAPVSIWLLVLAPGYTGNLFFVWLTYITMGLMATLLTGHQMQYLWLKRELRSFDIGTFILGSLLLVASIAAPGDNSPSWIEQMVITGACGVAALRVLHQGISSYRAIV